MRRITPVALVLLLLLGSSLCRAAGETARHYRIDEKAGSLKPENRDVILRLHSATLSGSDLFLQLSFLNARREPLGAYGVIAPGDIALRVPGGELVAAKDVPANLTLISPGEGLPPGLANAGTVRFPFPGPDVSGHFSLRVMDFAPISFALEEGKAFEPAGLGAVDASFEPKATLLSSHPSLGFVRLHVDRMRFSAGELLFSVAFENGAHRELNIQTGLTGHQFVLIDAHQHYRSPTSVTENLSGSIAPGDRAWRAGERNAGWIGFAAPHPHAAEQIALGYPGYAPLILAYDPGTGDFVARDAQAPIAIHPALEAADRFRSISAWCGELTSRLAKHHYEHFLAAFSEESGARAQISDFLLLLSKVPVGGIEFRLPREQDVSTVASNRAPGVKLLMSYRIEGVDLALTAGIVADLVRPEAGTDEPWVATRFEFDRQIPFWLLGYTGIETSDHFRLFYRPNSASESQIKKAARQAEHAYRELSRVEGLVQEKRFPAFFISREDDFEILTGRSAKLINGAVASLYEIENDRFLTQVGGLFINDFNFLNSSNMWGIGDRARTLTHELVHLALVKEARPFTPLWIVEGTAVHFAGQNNSFGRQALRNSGLLDRISLRPLTRRLPVHADSSLAGVENVKYQYLYSGEVVSFLIREFGEERFLAFFRAFAAYRPSQLREIYLSELGGQASEAMKLPVMAVHLTEKLVREHFDLSFEEIDAQVRGYVRRKTI